MSPEKAVKLLNEYFSAMHDVIEKHNGQIINYIGDSVIIPIIFINIPILLC